MEQIGQVNLYVCHNPKCKMIHTTINLNSGVTPFMITCRKCGVSAQSSFYRVKYGAVTCNFAWYRPTLEEFKRMDADMQEHVLGSGLVLGELSQVISLSEPSEVTEALSRNDTNVWLSYIYGAYKPDSELFNRVAKRLEGSASGSVASIQEERKEGGQ